MKYIIIPTSSAEAAGLPTQFHRIVEGRAIYTDRELMTSDQLTGETIEQRVKQLSGARLYANEQTAKNAIARLRGN